MGSFLCLVVLALCERGPLVPSPPLVVVIRRDLSRQPLDQPKTEILTSSARARRYQVFEIHPPRHHRTHGDRFEVDEVYNASLAAQSRFA